MVSLELEPGPDLCALTPSDQDWLGAFGVDPSWQGDERFKRELTDMIELGSLDLRYPANQPFESQVVAAREKFMDFVGISPKALDKFRCNANPQIVPLDTFIETQRVMYRLGLDAPRLIASTCSTIGFAPDSVQEKVDNMTQLGLDAPKVINAFPQALGFSQESVRAKVDNMNQLGLDGPKVIHSIKTALGFSQESVRAKVDNMNQLGLDTPNVINAFPSALSLSPESVARKMLLLERSAKVLGWEHDPKELIAIFPSVLGMNMKKLAILRRMAARYISEADRALPPGAIPKPLMVPLEKYIIELGYLDDRNEGTPIRIKDLARNASKRKIDSEERRRQAIDIAGQERPREERLGRIGAMYLQYAEK